MVQIQRKLYVPSTAHAVSPTSLHSCNATTTTDNNSPLPPSFLPNPTPIRTDSSLEKLNSWLFFSSFLTNKIGGRGKGEILGKITIPAHLYVSSIFSIFTIPFSAWAMLARRSTGGGNSFFRFNNRRMFFLKLDRNCFMGLISTKSFLVSFLST